MRSMLRGLRALPRLVWGSGNTVSCGLGAVAASTLLAAMAAAIEGGRKDGTYWPPGFLAGVSAVHLTSLYFGRALQLFPRENEDVLMLRWMLCCVTST